MLYEQIKVSEKFRGFLDGRRILKGELTITVDPRDGVLFTLTGKVVKLVEVVYNEASGEIDEIYLEEVRE